MRLVLMGPPGAGKGTLAKALVDEYNVPHISSGDIFRAEIGAETELGRSIKKYLDAGDLVPDEITVRAVVGRLEKPDCADGWILDGFPRTEGQARALDEALAERNENLNAVVYLGVSEETIVERMAGRRSCPNCGRVYHVTNLPPRQEGRCDDCGAELLAREDDRPETVRARLQTYRQQTAPLIDYYESRGLLVRVDGEGTPEEVRARLFEKLSAEGAERRERP